MNESEIGVGCFLPAAQAVITGIFAGLLARALAQWGNLDAGQTWTLALAAGAGAALLVWLTGLMAWRRAAFQVDELPGFEPDTDLQTGAIEPVRVEIARENGLDLIDLPASREQITALAQGLLEPGATLAESRWTGSTGVFTRAEFASLRAELIRRGLAVWNSPRTPARGATLTAPGRAVMRRFASMTGDYTLPHRSW